MDVSPQGAFDRIVHQKKGSYCYGRNLVLLEVLHGLGFRSVSAFEPRFMLTYIEYIQGLCGCCSREHQLAQTRA